MANKIMHHMIHGDDTYEIVDKVARENDEDQLLRYMNSTVKPDYLYKLNLEKLYTQGICTNGNYLYFIDFNSNSDCDLVKVDIADGTEISRITVTDLNTDLSATERQIHGNGIAFCAKDNYIYLTNIRGNYVFRFNANDLSYADRHQFRSSFEDPNNAIAYDPNQDVFVYKRSFSNEIVILTYNQVTGNFYQTHATFPYKTITKFRCDFGTMSWSEQNIAVYGGYILIAKDRHSGKQRSGMSVYGINGRYIRDIVFDVDTVGELEGISVLGNYIYALYSNGDVYRFDARYDVNGGSLISWGGNVDFANAYKQSLKYYTLYDAEETAVASGIVNVAGDRLICSTPNSRVNLHQAAFLNFYIECDSHRALPIVLRGPVQNYEHGDAQTRHFFTTVTDATVPTVFYVVDLRIHFDADTTDNSKGVIVIDAFTCRTLTLQSNGTFTTGTSSNLRIDGIVAEYY